jgi:hypothetical protein
MTGQGLLTDGLDCSVGSGLEETRPHTEDVSMQTPLPTVDSGHWVDIPTVLSNGSGRRMGLLKANPISESSLMLNCSTISLRD